MQYLLKVVKLQNMDIKEILIELRAAETRGGAARLIEQGAVKINSVVINSDFKINLEDISTIHVGKSSKLIF